MASIGNQRVSLFTPRQGIGSVCGAGEQGTALIRNDGR